MEVPAWERALAYVSARVDGPPLSPDLSVTVHFHPDRLVDGVPLLSRLASDGIYRSQFETRTSNGGLTAVPGGERWWWEHRIFGGHYDAEPSSHRPKYGALNYWRHPAGGAVRFGSSHLRLAAHVLERVTFCYPDSSTSPTHFGTAEHMPLIDMARAGGLDVLDDHIEAHVHGTLRLEEDVDLLVLDPSFLGTPIAQAAERLPFPTMWHHGFRLHVSELEQHADFRGLEVVEVGRRLAQGGWLTARVVGDAVQAGTDDPQLLKRLWHCIARFGYSWPRR